MGRIACDNARDVSAAHRLGDLSMLPSNKKNKKSKANLKPTKALTVSTFVSFSLPQQ